MFRKTKNIDTAFRQVRLFALIIVGGCLALTAYALYTSRRTVAEAHRQIYILANGKALEAFAAESRDNIPVEARDHIKMFHHYFFTLDPDETAITHTITKALYLADASAKQEYDNLKEKGYFTNLIAGNMNQEIEVDSVQVNVDGYPYFFRCFATQHITRTTSVVTRSLITEGYLRKISRSEHNSHGFLIEKWRTVDNRDINIQNR